jgi:hypothetical protein
LIADRTVFGDAAYLALPAQPSRLVTLMERFGKKRAGATLDGRTHRESPAW